MTENNLILSISTCLPVQRVIIVRSLETLSKAHVDLIDPIWPLEISVLCKLTPTPHAECIKVLHSSRGRPSRCFLPSFS